MSTVTLHPSSMSDEETPSQQVVRAASKMVSVTDEAGRRIGWRRLNALEDFDLTEIAGANSTNDEWMLRASIAFGVRELEGEPVARPANKNQLRAIIARLDDAGMKAILRMLAEEQTQEQDASKDRARF